MRIVFTGSHSTGKSTLMSLLAGHWPNSLVRCCRIQEVARAVLLRGLPLHYESTIETYLAITESHVAAELSTGRGSVLIDRFLPDYAAYANVHGNCPSDLLKLMEHCHKLLAKSFGYDQVFYLPVEFSVADDGYRLIDPKYQLAVDRALKTVLESWHQNYTEIRGTKDERLAQALALITS